MISEANLKVSTLSQCAILAPRERGRYTVNTNLQIIIYMIIVNCTKENLRVL